MSLSQSDNIPFAVAAAPVASVMSDSVRPHRWQPTRLCHPWDSPGKNTGMGCHFLLQCMKVKVKSLSRVQLSATLPGSSVHGIFQARVLEWGAIAFFRYPEISLSSVSPQDRSLDKKCSPDSSLFSLPPPNPHTFLG